MYYTLWKGFANNQGDVYGCPTDQLPNCVQQHQPIGQNNMRVESDFEEVNWQSLLMRLEQKYHKGPECLKVGDEIGFMLVPSFSKFTDLIADIKRVEADFVFDIVLDDRINEQAALSGEVYRSTYPAPTGEEGDDGCCSTEVLAAAAESLDFAGMVDPNGGPVRYTDWYCMNPPVRVGCAAGILKFVIKAVPANGVTLSGSNIVVRGNYDNAYSCCHAAACGSDCGGC